jgi:NADH dehydrogenase/NADH:ubiquinone oxidoreductase subunit G
VHPLFALHPFLARHRGRRRPGFSRNRGSHSTLTRYPGKDFDNNYTLNTVDICPVGALTSRDFRFQMRVWFLKESKSVCTSCATGCNIVIGSREDKVYRYEPRQNDAVNSCWMCDSGRLNYKWINREDRLTRLQGSKAGRRESERHLAGALAAISEILARRGPAPPPSSPPRARPTRNFIS